MIRVETLSGEYLNNFPTLQAVAMYCMRTKDLWQYVFLDEDRLRYISYVEIENEIEKLQRRKQWR